MKILGLNISRIEKEMSAPQSRGGWWPVIRESFTQAWQQNVTINADTVLSFHAVFACQTLIASDIAKLRLKLVTQDSDGIWTETKNKKFSVLKRPNTYQNRIQFIENWVNSKLQRGNTYILKRRNGRGEVIELYILAPDLVTPLISDSGEIFYELRVDNLTGITERIIAPAREIIHDRFNCFFHPLVGLSPIYANGLAATQGLAIQTNSTKFFQNGSRPGGVLTAPGAIGDETAGRLKAYWDANFSGDNVGKVAVLGDGLRYEQMSQKAVDSQMIEQLKWTAEVVCSTYHVPPYKIGVGQMPTYNNVQSLNVEYYSQCLQILIESIELCLDEGLETGDNVGTEFDLDGLLRMDSVTQMEVLDKGKNVLTPNEARKRVDLKPKAGGDAVYRQQQDYSIEALSKRDAKDDPFGKGEPPKPENDNMAEESAKALLAFTKGMR